MFFSDTLRKLLQTLKSTLGRLIEHQRKEREQFAGVTQASLSQLSQVEMMVQTSQLVELGKRQKAVVELLAKQKDLASKLKEMDSANDGSRERKNNETDVDTTMKNIPNRENLNKASDNNNNNEFTKNGNMPKCLAKDAGMSLSDANKLPKKKQNRKSKNKIQAGSDKETSSEEIKKDFGNPATGLSKLEEISFSDNSSSGMGPATQESGSGLMDILKILGNRKRQKSISELARSVHELASGSNSEASSTSAMVDQDSLRDDTTVDSDHESANFTEKNKGAAGNLEKNALDTTNYDSEETINEKENIREKMSVIPTKEAERLNDKSNTIADSADIDEVRESVSELIKADDISLEKTGKRNVVKEIAKKKVHVKESSLTENQEKADFVKENNVTINQREESNSLVLSLDKIEMCVKRSEKKIMEQTKNKTENQDILMTDENVSNQEDNSKGIKSGTTAKSVAETENDAEKELEIDDKGVTEMVNSGKSAPNKTSKIHDDAVKNRAGKPSILYEPPDASNKTGKRSLSDYDPSTGGIDPRTVYGHTKASSPEMVYINDESSPEAIKPKSFYKQKVGTITDRDDTLGLDAAGCVTDRHQDEEMLSQDVTTIPDTQEPSTQETITRY